MAVDGISPEYLAGLQEMVSDIFMGATINVYSRVLAPDLGGVATESWPGMAGMPTGAPRLSPPGRLQPVTRIPVEDSPGGAKIVVGLFIIKFPVLFNSVPVVLNETDRFSTTDITTGVTTEYKMSNVYQGISTQITISVYAEKIV